jgi:hypothetical protein
VSVIIPFANVELDRHLVLGFDDLSKLRSLDQLFGGGQPLPVAAIVGKLGENNPGTVDGATS